ncbi:unnamed protein product [Jaminaea pallidilutea]
MAAVAQPSQVLDLNVPASSSGSPPAKQQEQQEGGPSVSSHDHHASSTSSPASSSRDAGSGSSAGRVSSPPTSPSRSDHDDAADSLSDIKPAYFYPMDPTDANSQNDESGVPVFEPTMGQFADFYRFCQAIDQWGMKSGIVKVVPPKEWTGSLPSLRAPDVAKQEEQAGVAPGSYPTLESVRIKSAIAQHFGPAFKPGLWRQTNVTRPAKIWNVKQWSDVCRENSGPSMERVQELVGIRRDLEQSNAGSAVKDDGKGIRTRSGRARAPEPAKSSPTKRKRKSGTSSAAPPSVDDSTDETSQASSSAVTAAAQPQAKDPSHADLPSAASSQSKTKTADLTTSAEWEKFEVDEAWREEWKSGKADEELPQPSDWSPTTCREIEAEYWRGLNFGKPPMYGADLKGTLFTPQTKSWNVNSLDNLLTRLKLRRKIAGVTDPYLYFGMWRATFAWHVEDMDLYSINYIHFGAPKQWYAIPQKDRLRFETALASAFPAEARRCSQFMRHKSFLASPTFLAANNIRPVKLVQHAREFVITYPFGYHSGFNLGFNCAESVNFALESWLDIGRKAKACECDDAQQSVTMDVDAMLEESEELEQAERRKAEREQLRRDKERNDGSSEDPKKVRAAELAKARRAEKKRLKEEGGADGAEEGTPTAKKLKPSAKATGLELPCIFCPSSSEEDTVPIPSEDGAQVVGRAHRFCANNIPECFVGPSGTGDDEVKGFHNIVKARWSLKCSLCPPASAKYGCAIQCTYGTCSKAAHPTCAAQELHGWQMDLLPSHEADKVEARGAFAPAKKLKKASKASKGEAENQSATEPVGAKEEDVAELKQEEASDNAANEESSVAVETAGREDTDKESSERWVALCRAHNPAAKQADQLNKIKHLRLCAMRLRTGSSIKIKASGGIWEATLVAVGDAPNETSEGEALVDDGKGSTKAVKWNRIVFAPEIVAAAQEAAKVEEAETRTDAADDSQGRAEAVAGSTVPPDTAKLVSSPEFARLKSKRPKKAARTETKTPAVASVSDEARSQAQMLPHGPQMGGPSTPSMPNGSGHRPHEVAPGHRPSPPVTLPPMSVPYGHQTHMPGSFPAPHYSYARQGEASAHNRHHGSYAAPPPHMSMTHSREAGPYSRPHAMYHSAPMPFAQHPEARLHYGPYPSHPHYGHSSHGPHTGTGYPVTQPFAFGLPPPGSVPFDRHMQYSSEQQQQRPLTADQQRQAWLKQKYEEQQFHQQQQQSKRDGVPKPQQQSSTQVS